jgi:hypothetical protein
VGAVSALDTAAGWSKKVWDAAKIVKQYLVDPAMKVVNCEKEASPLLEMVGQAKNAYNVAKSALGMVSGEGTTEAAQETSSEQSAMKLGGAAASLLGVTSALTADTGILLNVGVQLWGIVKGLLAREEHDYNRLLMMNMDLDNPQLNWKLEPGGKAMFLYMIQVMNAGDSAEIPQTIPGAIESYLMDHRDLLEAGTQQEVPTEGWVFKDLDVAKARRWIFRNRRSLWSMFYGDLRPQGVYFG